MATFWATSWTFWTTIHTVKVTASRLGEIGWPDAYLTAGHLTNSAHLISIV